MLHYETHILSPQHDWVVFLHGLGGNSNIWYKQVKEFKKHFNLLFIDLRDHGGSADYEPEILTYTPEILSKDVVTGIRFSYLLKRLILRGLVWALSSYMRCIFTRPVELKA